MCCDDKQRDTKITASVLLILTYPHFHNKVFEAASILVPLMKNVRTCISVPVPNDEMLVNIV